MSRATARRGALLHVLFVVMLLPAAACRSDGFLGLSSTRVHAVSAELYGLGDGGGDFLPVGDTASLQGFGSTDGPFSRRVLDSFRSDSEARAFTWASSDPEVATVSPRGFVTTRAAGTTRIRVSVAGVTSEMFVLNVYPAVASVALEPERGVTSLEVGGSVRVRAVALDAQGRELAGVPLSPFSTEGRVAGAVAGSAESGVTPTAGTFGAWQAGATTIFATTPHPRASGRRSASVPLTVTDPGYAPDTLPRETADLRLRVSAARTTLRRGDTTTVRLVLYNRAATPLRFSASASCALDFTVVLGDGSYASPVADEKCSAVTSFIVAAGDSLVRRTLWRADDGSASATPLTPGLYWISPIARGEPDLFALGSLLAIRILP